MRSSSSSSTTTITTTDAAADNTVSFNFSAVSANERIVHAGARPGVGKCFEQPGAIQDAQVADWAAFMKTKGIKRVLCLLSSDELEWYAYPYRDMLCKHGFRHDKVAMVTMACPTAGRDIQDALEKADASEEPIVIHCSNGGGRAGLVSSLWVQNKQNVSADQACAIVLSHAERTHTTRRADSTKLVKLSHRPSTDPHRASTCATPTVDV